MTQQTQSGNIGFLGVLTLILITLKLIGYITWSWWWVLAPMWVPLTIALTIGLVAIVIFAAIGR